MFKKKKEKVSALIVAGGVGSRMGADIPKQFLKLFGKPVIAHTIEAFEKNDCIDEIVIVTLEDYIVFCKDIVDSFGFSKVKKIVSGGSTRQESVYKGLMEITGEYVLIHDGARPIVSQKVIENCVGTVTTSSACAVGVKVNDTLKIADDNKIITSTPDREHMYSIQTPQAFSTSEITEAHKFAVESGFVGTDDAVLYERLGKNVKIVEGDYSNIKITSPIDISIAEAYLGK